jgi:hypothetical protein
MLWCGVAAAPHALAQADRSELEESLDFRAETMAYSIGVQACATIRGCPAKRR